MKPDHKTTCPENVRVSVVYANVRVYGVFAAAFSEREEKV